MFLKVGMTDNFGKDTEEHSESSMAQKDRSRKFSLWFLMWDSQWPVLNNISPPPNVASVNLEITKVNIWGEGGESRSHSQSH